MTQPNERSTTYEWWMSPERLEADRIYHASRVQYWRDRIGKEERRHEQRMDDLRAELRIAGGSDGRV